MYSQIGIERDLHRATCTSTVAVLELIDEVLIYINLPPKKEISLSANHSRYIVKPIQIAEVLVVPHKKA